MTTAYIAPSFGAGWQALDNLGNPLSGGFLYTYSAGTTTPYSTWTDSTLSVPNANPIILNSAGRPPNEIWFDSTSYKFVLTDSLSNVLGTWDNIQGVAGPAGSTPVISGTSLTSQTIGTGSFTFVTQANISLVVGQWVTVSYSTTPSNYFYGQITAYSGTSLTVNVTVISGSGTYASWVISISGVRGPTGSPGAGSGTVTSVAVATANGFAGSVATSTTTPNITLSCNTIGILQGNGTAISAITVGSGLSFSGGTLAASSSAGGTVTSVSGTGGGTGLTLTGGPITTSGTLSLGGILGITNGGTGQSSANAALNALLPSQATYSGQSLVTNGTNTSWTQVGTVYSVGMTVPAFLSITGTPVTGTGTLAIGLSGTPLPIANGGTGLTTLTAGYIPYGNGTGAFSSSANMTFDGSTLTTLNTAYTGTLTGGTGIVNLGSGQFYKTSAGIVGIGTATPATFSAYANLGVLNGIVTSTNTTDGGVYIGATTTGTEIAYLSFGRSYNLAASGDTVLSTSASKPLIFGTNNAERMRIDSSGNVGIGTTSPSFSLQVQKSGDSRIAIVSTSGSNTAVTQYSTNNGSSYWYNYYNGSSFVFQDNANERMRIDSSGNLCLGQSSSTVGGSSWKQAIQFTSLGIGFSCTNSSGNMANFYTSTSTFAGAITSSGSVTLYTSASDYRLKENIAPIKSALAKVALLKPVTYDWKAGGSSQGFIAHELAEVFPEAVVGKKDEVNEDGSIKPQSIDTSSLVATLTSAIQEQQTIIELLTTRLTALEAK